jgi:methylglutaconyl-CoA hydratase
MVESLVNIERRGQAATIVLNRPDRRNALSRQLMTDIRRALEQLAAERSVRVVILTGAGTAFCAGMDLAEMLETSRQEDPHPQWHADAAAYRDLVLAMLQLPKPTIAAVNGPAMAGGAGLVLASDIVLATPTAAFAVPEPQRGLVAGIVSPLLAFRVGGGHAANLLLTARRIEAEEAYRIGLYHELVDAAALFERAQGLAAECAKGAPEALRLTKQMLYETIGKELLVQLAAGAALSAAARTTEAAAEGIAAFMEKRSPDWDQ